MASNKTLIIIGAGLSGLYAATLLQDKYTIIILEARARLGGRILTQDGHDLGPSWIWPHQQNILALIHKLGLETFAQYTKGQALYDSPQGVQRFNAPSSAPSLRLKGGLNTLITKLASQLPSGIIHTGQEVQSIIYRDNTIHVKTNEDNYEADYVISTLAPRLACEHISYTPDLTDTMKKKMLNTPTWMGNTAKCVVEFTEAFWKEEGLSGFIYSPLGPLGEIHDASTQDKPALFGFVHSQASTSDIEDDVKVQMKRLFAEKSQLITRIYFTDWRKERFSSSIHDKKGLTSHPAYGLKLSHFGDRLFFIGTETAYDNGGYLEGALASTKETVEQLGSVLF